MKKRSNFQIAVRLMGLVRPLTGYMLLAITFGVAGHLCATLIPIFGGVAFLDLLGVQVPIALRSVFFSVLVFALLRGLFRYGEQYFNHFIAFKLLALIRDQMFGALRRLSPAKLEGEDKGNLISVITQDIELLEVFFAHTISPIAIAFLTSLAMSVLIGYFHPLLALIAVIAYLTIGAFIPLTTSKLSGDEGLHYRNQSGDLSTFVLDSLRGLPEILQYGLGNQRLEEMDAQTDALVHRERNMKKRAGTNSASTNTVIIFFDLAMLVTASVLYLNGQVSFAGVLISVLALMSSFGPVVSLADLGSGLQNTFAAGDRVLDILDEKPMTEEITGQPDCTFSGAEVKNVTFSYGEETILDEISVPIPQNSVVGIVGRSGSGKSTLLRLLMRFWEVDEGEIAISGRNINQINTTDLREMQSFVTQETHLFQDSIANNLRIGKLDATQEEIEEACKKASIHDFILTLPQGYATPVGELGDTLSGGERQRLGLARAFLHDAPLLLLDEPTSNLDSLNEGIILKSIAQEREDKTVVLVSHRASTMRLADKVYSVENGRVS